MREAIHALKYKRRRDAAAPLAKLLAAQLESLKFKFDFMTCVPLYPSREAARGYNQAELLARETARLTGYTYLPMLECVRPTADQVGLDWVTRRANVREAFRAREASLDTKSIVIIDDVCTTGATLDACAEALFQRGAHAVYGLAVARPRFAPEQIKGGRNAAYDFRQEHARST